MAAGQRAHNRREALRLLIRTSRPHRRALALGLLATVGVVAMRLALPWPLRGIVEHVFPSVAGGTGLLSGQLGEHPILVFCGLYVLLSLGTGAFEWIQRVWMARVASRTAHDLRVRTVSHLGPRWSRSVAETADLITRVIGDIARIRADIKGILIHLSQNGLLLLAITVLFLAISPVLGLLFLLSGLLAIVIGYQAVEQVARNASKQRRKESAYAAAIQDEEDDDDDEPESLAISASSTRKDVRTTRIIGRSTLLVHAAVGTVIALALWVGVRYVRAGSLAPGELFLFIAYAITIQRRAVMIGRQVARSGKLLANTERLGRLIEPGGTPEEPVQPLRRAIRLEGLRVKRFTTQSKKAQLGPLDLAIQRGQRVLVLGGEGAGKSSLLGVLAGRLTAKRGKIAWDERDVTDSPDVLRAAVDYVSDEPRFGRIGVRRLLGLSPDREPVADDVEALQKLGTWRIVGRLASGLDQQISSSDFSPTERRALLLGRTILGDAAVWILDNPVDGNRARDRGRMSVILDRAGDRTLVVALRRPVEMDRFERVVVLRRGDVEFDGTPSDWKLRRDQLREIRLAQSPKDG